MKHLTFAFIVLSFILSSCGSSTKLTNSWVNKENTPKHYEKLAIAALTPSDANRYVTERAIVDKLKEKGIKAIPTYEVLPMAGRIGQMNGELGDSEAIKKFVKKKINENNIDGLMVLTVFNKQTEQRWVNDRSYHMGGAGYYGTPFGYSGRYYDYYAYSFGTIYNDGYYVDDVTYFIDCNLYDIESEQMIWSGNIKIKNIVSVEEEADVLGYIIARQLYDKKIVIP